MFFSKIISKSKISNFNDDGVIVVKNIINKRIIKRIISEIEIITYDQLKKNRQKLKKQI